MKTKLSVVRRGYDPAEVQELVGQLANELKSQVDESEVLRARIVELEHLSKIQEDVVLIRLQWPV